MNLPIGLLMNEIDVFLLVFVRMTGLFVIAPIFGRRNIPAYLKIGFSFLLALILANTMALQKVDYNNIYQYGLIVFKEFVVGITIGYVSYLAYTAIYLAGQMIDMQVGFGMVNVLDPMGNSQISITSNFYFILCMIVFLGVNGHHLLIRALFDSFTAIPLGTAVFNNNLMNDILKVFGSIFTIGFKISAPIVAAILISDIALGIISKTVPQLNVFIVGMPLKIALGLGVMLLTIPVLVDFIVWLTGVMNSEMISFIKDMGLK